MNLDELKKVFYEALFNDDLLMESLVLKGGSAISSFHDPSATRTSVDLDFSMPTEFEDLDLVKDRFERCLHDAFEEREIHVYDVKLYEKPKVVSEDLQDFWGGYALEFKIIHESKADLPVEDKRRQTIKIAEKGTFKVDISKYEYIDGAEEMTIGEGVMTIQVYTPEMIVCEKLRAICQQMPEYSPIVRRGRPGTQRARDFYDVRLLAEKFGISLSDNKDRLRRTFEQKRVPFEFLFEICTDPQVREMHAAGYQSLKDTINGDIEQFDFYFDHVVEMIEKIR